MRSGQRVATCKSIIVGIGFMPFRVDSGEKNDT